MDRILASGWKLGTALGTAPKRKPLRIARRGYFVRQRVVGAERFERSTS